MNRRDFIRQSALLSAGTLVTLKHAAMMPANKYKMGLQLFTVNSLLAKDVVGTISRVAAIGYEDCETYGYKPEQGTYYGLKATQFKQLLDDKSLITTSGHYDFSNYFNKPEDDLMYFVDKCIEGAHALDQRYITWPWLDPAFRTLEHFRQLTGKLNRIGERVKAANLGFAYHHHDFEFTDHGGQNGYAIIMQETDPSLVKLQMDLYWVVRASKQSPAELINRQPGRFVMWHIKDMDRKTQDYTELGNGSIDFTGILPLATRAGLQYYYIEQGGNFAKDPIQSITDSAAYFKRNLEQYLS
ncbi:MAG TPA: sugar phosphate isomerase/epimerase [Flavisolibacter sp.]|jgi:sugar phosphate isomerase/epimerase|nr:sugar phosphate isomerase/epimerase [Flavisolibacter sp.]